MLWRVIVVATTAINVPIDTLASSLGRSTARSIIINRWID